MTQEPGKVGMSNSKEFVKEFVILAVAVLACCALLPASATASCGRPVNTRAAAISPASPLLQKLGLVQQAAASTGASGPASIVGLWHVTYQTDGQFFDEGFDQWHSDGTEVLNDTPPPALGNVCLGVFKKTGSNTYKLNHVAWNFDANGNLIGSISWRQIVTLDAGGNSYHGSFVFDIFDLSGNLTSEVTGDETAERIKPD